MNLVNNLSLCQHQGVKYSTIDLAVIEAIASIIDSSFEILLWLTENCVNTF